MAAQEVEVRIVKSSDIVWCDGDVDWVVDGWAGLVHRCCCLAKYIAEVRAAETARLVQPAGWDVDVEDGDVNVADHIRGCFESDLTLGLGDVVDRYEEKGLST